jgi:hypothetical protein
MYLVIYSGTCITSTKNLDSVVFRNTEANQRRLLAKQKITLRFLAGQYFK